MVFYSIVKNFVYMSREIKTQSFSISEVIDTIYDELLVNKSEISYIKI